MYLEKIVQNASFRAWMKQSTSVGMGSPVAVAVPEGWHPRGNARFAPHPTPGLL